MPCPSMSTCKSVCFFALHCASNCPSRRAWRLLRRSSLRVWSSRSAAIESALAAADRVGQSEFTPVCVSILSEAAKPPRPELAQSILLTTCFTVSLAESGAAVAAMLDIWDD